MLKIRKNEIINAFEYSFEVICAIVKFSCLTAIVMIIAAGLILNYGFVGTLFILGTVLAITWGIGYLIREIAGNKY